MICSSKKCLGAENKQRQHNCLTNLTWDNYPKKKQASRFFSLVVIAVYAGIKCIFQPIAFVYLSKYILNRFTN